MFSGKSFKKGELKLIPSTDCKNRIVDKSIDSVSKNDIEVKGGVRLFIHQPKLPSKYRSLEQLKADKLIIVPFWLVKDEAEEGGGNMEYQHMKVGEFSFTILTNSKAIKADEKLMLVVKPLPALKRQKTLTK